jgi:MFS superfamily sulfate permease-like transporter
MFMFTFLCTLILGLIPGIMISACVSLLLVVKHTTIPRLAVLGRTTGMRGQMPGHECTIFVAY